MDDFRRRRVNRVNPSGKPNAESGRPRAVVATPVPEKPRTIKAVPTPERSRVTTATPALNPLIKEDVSLEPNLTDIGGDTGLSPRVPFKKRGAKKFLLWLMVGVFALMASLFAGAYVLYKNQLSPVGGSNTKLLVSVEPGSTPSSIAKLLLSKGLIKSEAAFLIYTKVEGVQGLLQAGSYRLSPSESTQDIVKHLVSGNVDTFSITLLPGATLADNKKALLSAGYSEQEVDIAFAKDYQSKLFSGKPSSADLEGYIYGETYSFPSSASVEDILMRTFKEYEKVVEVEGLEAKFKARGLSLYQGITLASIIQREASPGGSDMPQISQVFYTRMARGMELGSDVTYQYIADKTGVPRSPNLDSLYNTRKYPGLPPGPIAVPGKKALMAAASPASGEYIYFLSGDDDVTYYAKTLDGHEANIRNHCQEKCKIL